MECDTYSFSALTLLAGRQEGHLGLLVVMIQLQLCASYTSSCHHYLHHPVAPIKSRMETFWYQLTQVHLENGH